jgi:hypothetical protein
MSPVKRKVAKEITLSDIEQEIKRALSDREISAIMNLRGQLPEDRRKRKRLIRKARKSARLEDLKDPRILSAVANLKMTSCALQWTYLRLGNSRTCSRRR